MIFGLSDWQKLPKGVIMNGATKALLKAFGDGYEVSKDGKRVRGIRTDSLVLTEDNSGYLRFSIHLPSKTTWAIHVHRLQAYQKFGNSLLKPGIQVRHLDGNKKNNAWKNIEIGSQSDNRQDMPKAQRVRAATIAGRSGSPLSASDVLEIVRIVDKGNYNTYQELAESYGLRRGTSISDIINGRRWASVTGF